MPDSIRRPSRPSRGGAGGSIAALGLTRATACVLVSLLGGLMPGGVMACTCAPVTVAEAVDAAEAVFVGTVSDIVIVREEYEGWGPMEEWTVTLQVGQAWKGVEPGDTMRVVTPQFGCGVWFEEGERYVVYARRAEDGTLWTDICARTVALEEGAREVRELDEECAGFVAKVVREARRYW